MQKCEVSLPYIYIITSISKFEKTPLIFGRTIFHEEVASADELISTQEELAANGKYKTKKIVTFSKILGLKELSTQMIDVCE